MGGRTLVEELEVQVSCPRGLAEAGGCAHTLWRGIWRYLARYWKNPLAKLSREL